MNYIYIFVFIILIILSIMYYFYGTPPKFKQVSPQVVIGAMKSSNVIIVNALSDKIPYLANSNVRLNNNLLSKQQLDTFLKNNNYKLPANVHLIIIMCANWDCKAGYNYYKELFRKGIPPSKMVDYAGGLHEWALYNLYDSNLFNFININTKSLAPIDDVRAIVKMTMHTYLVKDELASNNKTLSLLAKDGEWIAN